MLMLHTHKLSSSWPEPVMTASLPILGHVLLELVSQNPHQAVGVANMGAFPQECPRHWTWPGL